MGVTKMKIKLGNGKSILGPGIDIEMSGNDVVLAITAYLIAHNIRIDGARTITVNNELCKYARVRVDPSGFVIRNGKKINGKGITK